MSMLLVFTTVPDADEGDRLAKQIIDAGLAACVQILPPMKSVYMWEGQVKAETEHLLLIKTLKENWSELEKFIAVHHSYTVPEIVAIEADGVSAPYLNWVKNLLDSTRNK